MLGQRQEIAQMQSDFYREKYYKRLRALLMSVCIMVVLILVVTYLVLFRAPPRYYAMTTEGQIFSMPTPTSGI